MSPTRNPLKAGFSERETSLAEGILVPESWLTVGGEMNDLGLALVYLLESEHVYFTLLRWRSWSSIFVCMSFAFYCLCNSIYYY